MRLFEFENTKFDDFKSAVPFLEKNCSDILKVYFQTKKVLMRGIKGRQEIFIDQSPKFRKPKNTPKRADELINSAMQAAGFSALRSNSIFCTTDRSDASFYGFPYYIFPFNGFDFSWSTMYSDLTLGMGFSTLDIDNEEYGEETVKLHFEQNADISSELDFKLKNFGASKFCDLLGLSNENLVKAVQSGHEVLIHGQYVAVVGTQYQSVQAYFQGTEI